MVFILNTRFVWLVSLMRLADTSFIVQYVWQYCILVRGGLETFGSDWRRDYELSDPSNMDLIYLCWFLKRGRNLGRIRERGGSSIIQLRLDLILYLVLAPVWAEILVILVWVEIRLAGFVVSREQARSRTKKAGRILSYDEMIEGENATSFLDDPDFRFEVPEDVENI